VTAATATAAVMIAVETRYRIGTSMTNFTPIKVFLGAWSWADPGRN
jgi:hypothetical protein